MILMAKEEYYLKMENSRNAQTIINHLIIKKNVLKDNANSSINSWSMELAKNAALSSLHHKIHYLAINHNVVIDKSFWRMVLANNVITIISALNQD